MGIVSVYLSEDQHEKWRQICKLGQSGQSETFQRILESAYRLAELFKQDRTPRKASSNLSSNETGE